MLSATSEDLKFIDAAGKLDDWCTDSIDWLKETFGKDNLVSAVLHMDEKTPHIHATVVPVVTGERRKANAAKPNGNGSKKKYRKKNPDAARLCADDVMARDRLKHYQDSYAKRMQKYGLERGVEGSEAKHINTQQYYRDMHLKAEALQENIGNLEKHEQQARQNLSRIKSEVKTEKLKSSAVTVATSAIEGIGSVFGTSKAKKQQQEIEALKLENSGLQVENQTLKEQIQANKREYAKITDSFRQKIEKIYALFPMIKELLRIANLCLHLRFGEDLTKKILRMKPVTFKGELYSSEYQRYFKTENSVAEVKPSDNEPDKLRLMIDGLSDVEWFRQKTGKMQAQSTQEQKKDSSHNRGLHH
jgi:hypothetical protein